MSESMHGTGWQVLTCEYDRGPADRAAIGMITLSNDLSSEGDVRAHFDSDGIGLFVTRIAMSREASVSGLRAMESELANGAKLLVPDDRIDVVAYACTSGAVEIGEKRIEEIIMAVRPVPTTTAITAATTALRTLGARRIALLTPYPADINAILERHLEREGFELVAKGTFDQRGDPEICRVSPATIEKAAVELCARSGEIEALFISCTALRTNTVIESIEVAIERPVIASNQAMAWHCLTLAEARTEHGRGQLFRLAPPGRTATS